MLISALFFTKANVVVDHFQALVELGGGQWWAELLPTNILIRDVKGAARQTSVQWLLTSCWCLVRLPLLTHTQFLSLKLLLSFRCWAFLPQSLPRKTVWSSDTVFPTDMKSPVQPVASYVTALVSSFHSKMWRHTTSLFDSRWKPVDYTLEWQGTERPTELARNAFTNM